jgi:HK97 family phage portal protein
MGLLSWWRGRNVKLTDGAFWSSWFGTESWSGKTVTPDGAMQLAAWWSCVRLISETVATLPIGVFERGSNGQKAPANGHPLYRLLHDSPNADQTAAEFWEGMVASLCIFGNAYARKEIENGRLVSLTPIASDSVTVTRDENGVLRYKFTENRIAYDLTENDVFHIRGFGIGGDIGLSPVSYARQTLGIAMAIGEASGKTFSQGMRASGFFKYKGGVLTPEQRAQAKKVLVDTYSGHGSSAAAGILEADFDWVSANVNPHDAEMLLSWKFSTEEICRWLRVPPILVGHAAEGQTMWGSGVEQIMLGWLTLGLRPYLSRVEQAIKKRLIGSNERDRIFAEFNVEGLLRADSAGRAALYSTFAQNGINTRNEIRARENLPPLPGGDDLTVQSNLVPLDMLGQQQQKPMIDVTPNRPALEPAK